ncbi:GntR family transcriptional regulator [Kumtagia ephedrae]|jgi:DNA-binding GntR family transcriptional regulator|uniref:GntR family transcriptional regulator n=1 Tax=Kumtagia ephedrae TaxID=2116701 RepID=A0A2P7SPL2_9HYPH|nr:GntR family transcriptional regulator [Mesorhizobium ephedrae]PSJ64305.1 GntR family transcriptional regulator [Mesorhizobium ephedrae]
MASADFKRPGFDVVPLTRDTLQDRVFENITELILDGSLVPGEMVTVQSLASAFGVSPMPVREALRRLMAANALTVVSGRSIGIPKLSRERLTDLRNVRFEIEAIAAAWAAERRTEADIEVCAKQFEKLDAANAEGNVKAYLRANYAFHFAIYRAAGSDNLLKIIENLWLQISPFFNMLHGSGNYSTANTHHKEMLEALRGRDADAIRRAVRADIDAAYHVLEGLL